jgi:L-lactate dehydrogenase complex protein LldG
VIRTEQARGEILRAIRENLAKSSPPVEPSPSYPLSRRERGSGGEDPEGRGGQGVRTGPDLVARFTEQLAAVGAQFTVAHGEADAARGLARILTDAGVRQVVGSDAPLVQRLLGALGDGFVVQRIDGLSRDELFQCDAGVTTAQWGIAETGTLVLESARERNRLLSLVPPIHVALLSTSCICDSLGEALARVRSTEGDPAASLASHAITLITGPSRSADIELTLVIGVHGPQAVHVLLLEEEET